MKETWHVFALTRLQAINLRVLHHVRDSRGVAYSNTRRVARQGGDPGSFRGQFPPLNTGARWLWTNLALELVPHTGTPTMVTRYEQIIREPRQELLRISEFAGRSVAESALEFLQDGVAHLPPDHLVAGNRLRLNAGPTHLRRDEAWRVGLSRRDQLLVSGITWPLRRRYAAPRRGLASRRSRART
jgi:hypothetical protein